jgi:predicted DNA-binding transcriptional regulator AlpA
MTQFLDIAPLRAGYRSPRTGRQADRYADRCRRLAEARNEAQAEHAGGASVQPTPSRTPRRTTTTSRKPASGSDADGDSEPAPARRRVVPLFLDLQDVADAVALSTRGVQRLVQLGEFPKPRVISARRVAWLVRDIEEWAVSRPIADLLPPPNAGQRTNS